MARKRLKNYIKTLRTKSGVGKHHEKHCPVKNSEQKQEHAGKTIPCEVINRTVNISSVGECSCKCSHAQ